MEDNNLWTPRELAKFLGYSESTIRRMVSQCPEKLPPRVASLGRPRGSLRSHANGHGPVAICRSDEVAVRAMSDGELAKTALHSSRY